MAFIENFIVPLIQAVISIGMFLLILVGIYFLVIKFMGDKILKIKLWFKYKLMKQPYNEHIVRWAMDMIEKKVPTDKLMRSFYLTNKFLPNQFEEGKYIYRKVSGMKLKNVK